MMKISSEQITAITCTLLLHVLVGGLLYFIVLRRPAELPEKGIEVMLGTGLEDFAMTAVNEAPTRPQQPTQPQKPVPPSKTPEEPLMTQDSEESLAVPLEKPEDKKEEKSLEELQREREEAERLQREKEERERLERERIERERREAEARREADNLMKSFKKSSENSLKGKSDKEEKSEGVAQGNSEKGIKDGIGISFSLEGRTIGEGGTVRPVYDVQQEGVVIVNITVSPAGKVIRATANPRSALSKALRDAAVKAALNQRFNEVGGVNNQTGTITYNFSLTK